MTKDMIEEALKRKNSARTPMKSPGAKDGSGTIEKELEDSKKSPASAKTLRYADESSMASQRTEPPAEISTITKGEDFYKTIQKARSVLDDSGDLINDSAFLPNAPDTSFISYELQHESGGAALSVFEHEDDDQSWKPLRDDRSIPRPEGETAKVVKKWTKQIATHTLNADTYMTQIRCLATEVKKDVLWCRLQVDRVAKASFDMGLRRGYKYHGELLHSRSWMVAQLEVCTYEMYPCV